MRLVSYNVNGIRAAIKKGLFDWIASDSPDIICIQETKSQPEQVDMAQLEELGYKHYWHSAEKKGYSGVLTITKREPKDVQVGIGIDRYDSEGRTVVTHFDDWTLVNVYIPSGSSGDERHKFKMEFLHDFGPWIDELKKKHKNLVVVGDYNVVRDRLDIHNPDRKDKPSGYKPDERAWLAEWFDSGFVDAFRSLYPEESLYSWWSYRAGARQRDKGWRIDYISITDPLSKKLKECRMYKDIMHSDHCPVIAEFDL